MKTSDLLRAAGVHEMISACRECGVSADWYIFGSASRVGTLPNDIDILCVVQNSEETGRVWRTCESYLLRAPIHLRTLSTESEWRLDFIKRSAAVALS